MSPLGIFQLPSKYRNSLYSITRLLLWPSHNWVFVLRKDFLSFNKKPVNFVFFVCFVNFRENLNFLVIWSNFVLTIRRMPYLSLYYKVNVCFASWNIRSSKSIQTRFNRTIYYNIMCLRLMRLEMNRQLSTASSATKPTHLVQTQYWSWLMWCRSYEFKIGDVIIPSR